mgnify:FL=1
MGFKFHYDEEYDILAIRNDEQDVEESLEVSEDIVLDLNKEGNVIGIEIFYASEFFGAFNKQVDKEFLDNLKEAEIEYKEFRNQWFVVVVLKTKDLIIHQPMPPLRKSKYISPLIMSS